MQPSSDRLVFLGRLTAGVAAICLLAWTIMLARELANPAYGGEAIDIDFATFWAAAKLALAEGGLAPFETERLNAARELPPDATKTGLWLYPPAWLTVLLPLGLIPFFWAWLIFAVISLAAFAAATRSPARDIPGAWPLLVSAPVVLMTLAIGQSSLIIGALLVVALEALRRERAVIAGLAIAAMTLKPQLGLAIPIALLAGSHWRVILWAALGTALILACSLTWPGGDYWPALANGIRNAADEMDAGGLSRIMITGYGTMSQLGLEHGAAQTAQGVVSLVVAGGLAWLWFSRAAFDLKAAGLALGILLITPYAQYYELVFVLIGCLYLARAGVLIGPAGFLLCAVFWLAPLVGQVLQPFPGFLFVAPLVTVAFCLTVYRAARAQ